MREPAVPLYRQRVRAALDDLINPVIIVRPDSAGGGAVQEFVVVYANSAAARLGTTPGTAWIHHDETVPRELFRRCVTALQRGTVVEETDLTVPAPGGGERTIDLRATRLGRELLVTWRDVTDRHRSELALAASEARYRGIIDSLADASAVMVPTLAEDGSLTDLVLQDVNPAALAWGVLPGMSVRAIHEGEGTPRLFGAYEETWRTGRRLALDSVQVPFPGGPPRFIDLRGVRVGDSVFATWRDVTSRHLAEQSLLESERRFRLAFDDAPIGSLLLDLSDAGTCLIRDANRSMADLLGVPAGELVGADLKEWVHPDDLTSGEALPRLLIGSGEEATRAVVKRLRRSDGEWLWVRVTASVMREEEGVLDVIAHVEDVTAQRRAEDELAHRALYDSLTGLANRTLLLDHLALAVHELGRDPGVLAVMFLDLDRFKDVNDTLGHAAGDAVLREVGARLRGAVRAPDTAARLAGDEFVVVARVGTDVDAVHLAERLYDQVAGPVELDGRAGGPRSVVVSPSVGVTTTTSAAVSPEALLREADLAMYQAKRQTRTSWALYDEALHSAAMERLAVEEALRAALAYDRLRLLYQPIIDVTTGRVVAVEALLRVDDPERGLLSPDRFIDVAEDSDLIVPIGAWVLEEACRRLRQWREVVPTLTMAVNVSARQVVRLALHDQVLAARRAAGVDPESLLVEITERVLLDADGPAVADLLCVTDDGTRLAIDDFGTGYSSLAYLKRFPVSVVKIDRSFVAGLGVQPDDTAIVEAIVGLAGTLGLTTVAEGVETPEQLAALRGMGCDRAQGFLLGRPVPPEEIDVRLRQEASVEASS